MDSASDEEYRERDDKSLGEREWKKLRNHRLTNGYKEGYSAGEEETLQQGFDEGYTLSVQMAFQIAKMRGNLCAYLCQEERTSSDCPEPSTEEAQNLVERLSALETSLAKARTNPKFSAMSQTADIPEKRCDESCECQKSKETDGNTKDGACKDKVACAEETLKTKDDACCKGTGSCGSGEGAMRTGSEGMKSVQEEMKHLTTLYEEAVAKWNKT